MAEETEGGDTIEQEDGGEDEEDGGEDEEGEKYLIGGEEGVGGETEGLKVDFGGVPGNWVLQFKEALR